MNHRFSGLTIGLLDTGVAMFLVGAFASSSLVSQLAAASGRGLDPMMRDLMIFGLIFGATSAMNHLWPNALPSLSESASPVLEVAPLPMSVNVCAGAMIVFFFLPWTQVFGAGASGYDLAKLGSVGTWALLMPVFAGIVLLNWFLGSANVFIATLTGAVPLFGLLYGLAKTDGKIFQIFGIGAYLTIVAGVAMILISQKLVGPNRSPT